MEPVAVHVSVSALAIGKAAQWTPSASSTHINFDTLSGTLVIRLNLNPQPNKITGEVFAGEAFCVFIVLLVEIQTEPATPVSQGGRGVEKPYRDDRDDL